MALLHVPISSPVLTRHSGARAVISPVTSFPQCQAGYVAANTSGASTSTSGNRSSCSSAGCSLASQHGLMARRRLLSVVRDASGAITTEDDVVRVASLGDLVTLHFVCKTPDGEVLESSYDVNEPLIFEVGAGDMMGNPLFQGFDEAVRGLAVGQKTVLEASGGEWKKELMFVVPNDHPEVQRLQGRYKNQGGLHRGLIVELANGAMAMVLNVSEQGVQIDANNMMAGKKLMFELEVVGVERPEAVAAAGQDKAM